jgi:hypothetical protein
MLGHHGPKLELERTRMGTWYNHYASGRYIVLLHKYDYVEVHHEVRVHCFSAANDAN